MGLGVARAAIDEFVELAGVKIPRSSSELLRDRSLVQAQVGEAEAVLRAGRSYLFDVVRDMWETVLAGELITERQRSDVRMAMTHGAQCAARAAHGLRRCGGRRRSSARARWSATPATPRWSRDTTSCSS